MLLGVIADDFTGASDIANTLARGLDGKPGLSTVQFLGVPKVRAPDNCEAGVVSLKTRSIPAAKAVSQSLEALAWLKAQGCRQFVFKYCSTFDSTPEGNIGPVAEALANELDVRGVVVCPAFPGAARTIYMGNLFVGNAPLNESSLRNHPLNPMSDSDIRRWLALQTKSSVGAVDFNTVKKGAAAIRSALDAASARGETLVIVDAISDEDLISIAEAVADAPLLTGGSGIALGLPANLARFADIAGRGPVAVSEDGPGAVLAGSCSAATLEQIEMHRQKGHPVLTISAQDVMTGKITADTVIAFVRENSSKAPLAYSSDVPSKVAEIQRQFGREIVAARLDALFAETAKALVDGGIRRLVVAGGETSGAVVTALNLDSLAIGPEIAAGVPILLSEGKLALALKSGNFGQPDFFDRALAMMAGEDVCE